MTAVDPNETFAPTAAATGIGRLLSVLQGLTSTPTTPTSAMDPFTNPTSSPNTPTSSTPTTTTSSIDPVPEGTAVSQGYGGESGHPGIDLAVPDGTKIAAAISGTVSHAANDDPGGYGQWVEITGSDGTVTRYGHLSGLAVKAGTAVKAGQVIGTSGGNKGEAGAGNSSGPHLHFEVRQGDHTVDPTPWLAGGSSIIKADPNQVTATQVPAAPTRDPQDVVDTSMGKLTDVFSSK